MAQPHHSSLHSIRLALGFGPANNFITSIKTRLALGVGPAINFNTFQLKLGWHLYLAQPSTSSLQIKLSWHYFNFLLRRCLCTQGHSLPVLPLGQPSVWHRRLDSTYKFSSMADGASLLNHCSCSIFLHWRDCSIRTQHDLPTLAGL